MITFNKEKLSKLKVLLNIIPKGKKIKNKVNDQINTEKDDLNFAFFLIILIISNINKYVITNNIIITIIKKSIRNNGLSNIQIKNSLSEFDSTSLENNK